MLESLSGPEINIESYRPYRTEDVVWIETSKLDLPSLDYDFDNGVFVDIKLTPTGVLVCDVSLEFNNRDPIPIQIQIVISPTKYFQLEKLAYFFEFQISPHILRNHTSVFFIYPPNAPHAAHHINERSKRLLYEAYINYIFQRSNCIKAAFKTSIDYLASLN